jgi:transaldolase
MLAAPITCPLSETANRTRTDYWNDSCSIEELQYAIARGAVGATTNPTIVLEVLKKEMPLWRERLRNMVVEHPDGDEQQLTWMLIEEMAVKAAELLLPAFDHYHGKKGRLSIQTNPTFYRNAEKIIAQAVHFNSLAANIQVKIPVTDAGVAAIEEVTFAGVSINATVSFSIPQALAVAEAVERGMKRRQAAGLESGSMSPVCTIMVGRLDDWLGVLIKRDQVLINPGAIHWAGIAAFKKAYRLYQERGYTTRLLAAAYRHHLHWSELIGGDIVLTIPYSWQKQFNAADIPVIERINEPVPEDILNELYEAFADFRRAYDVDGMRTQEFDTFGPTVRTLRSFIGSYHDLQSVLRDFMLPNPDTR